MIEKLYNSEKFIITPKEEKSVTFTLRLESDLNNYIENIARKSGRSRNELINKAIRFALGNIEFVDNDSNS